MSILSTPKSKQSTGKFIADKAANNKNRREPEPGFGRMLENGFRRAVFRRLRRLNSGQVTIVDGDGSHSFGSAMQATPPVELTVHDAHFYRYVALGGSLGAAESYIQGQWQCDNLVGLMRIFSQNFVGDDGIESRASRVMLPVKRMIHRLHRNTLGGSRRNIAAHYDLGDDFFSLFLDDTMAYSCGIFTNAQSSLQEASLVKFARVSRMLQLCEDDNVMEIGSGWGGFAIYAAKNHGCRITTTTISKKQYEFTLRKVRDEGLQDRITVLCQDYRHLQGRFDKLVSIEMIEAVGYEYFDTFFRTCSDLLKPHGAMLLQAITIPDQRFHRYRRSVDFIQRYIFPGGCLPSLGAICGSLGRVTDMRLVDFEDLTAHYALTLSHWRRHFHENIDQVRALGFREEFLRLWEYYFCYCEAGFRERLIADAQILLCKPKCRIKDQVPE
ncbi:MAG: class I SAM-dependent methyltransferase [Pirellulales bacterium]|nr:class I SAM-dependent methyltransferase [Pirellulales bacterium]